MTAGERTVKVKFTGDSKGVTKASDEGVRAVDKFKTGLDRASVAILATGTAVAIGLGKIGTDFDTAYDKIRIGTGATGVQLEGLKDDFRAVAAEVPATFGDIAEALQGLQTRLGITGKPLQALTEQIVNLNHITHEAIPQTVDAVTRLFGDWSIATDRQSAALDELFRASQSTGTAVDSIAASVVEFGAPLRQLGFSFDEAITLLGKWRKEGVNTELVLGGLKRALGQFSKAGEDPVKALEAFEKAIKTAGSAAEANQIAIKTLGVRAGPDFAAAVREGRFDFQSLLDTIQHGTETIASATGDTDSWTESLKKLKNDAMLAIEGPATSFFNAIDKALPTLQSALQWTKDHKTATNDLLFAIAGIAAIVLVTNAGIKVYTTFVTLAAVATRAWTVAQWALNVALDANPIGIVIIAIAAIVAGIIILSKAGVDFGAVWGTVWGGIKDAAVAVWTWLGNSIGTVKGWFASLGFSIQHAFWSAFNWVASAWNNTIGSLSFTVPGWVPGIGGAHFEVGKIRLRPMETGGVAFARRPYLVNEAGPEPFFPATNGRVISHADAMAALASGGRGGDVYVAVQVGDQPVREMVRAERVEADRGTRQWVLASSGVAA